MEILWQGTEITDYVMVRKAVARDTCGGRCDSIEIEFENAERWYRWGPQEDDEIRVTADGWDSGKLYLNTIAPTGGKYRVLATALPCTARQKAWESFEGLTMEEILRRCSAQTGMEHRLYGVDGAIRIPYIQRENESCAAFLERLGKLEGAKLKAVNGRYALIGLDWAQRRNPVATLMLAADQDGVDYRRKGTRDWRLVIETPYASGKAVDTDAADAQRETVLTDVPALDDIQAARWARNLLTEKNRQCESLTVESEFNPAWTAMARVDVTGGTDADGEWLIDEVEHDLKDERSRATMRRTCYSVQ